ncbi:F-box protein [Camellia lanceoleosa]|uniref:F-box protein n=1 Tax=Camellia lanceoleosa TaxID=1840588 RepID=A0ACC0GU80_9ERIC|nr:F-box protein [Camellia lanceoleosa]
MLDLTTKVYPKPYTSSSSDEINHFDLLPDSILLLIFNKIGDVKALGRCCVISRRFYTLVPQVENVVVRVDCVISDDDASSASRSSDKSCEAFSKLFRFVLGGIIKPLQALGQFLGPKRSNSISSSSSSSSSSSLSVGTGASADDELD